MADLAGTSGNDLLSGEDADDRIRTGGGNDTVNAGGPLSDPVEEATRCQ